MGVCVFSVNLLLRWFARDTAGSLAFWGPYLATMTQHELFHTTLGCLLGAARVNVNKYGM